MVKMSMTTSLSATSFHSTAIMNATKTSVIADDYDHNGAAIYIAGTLIFYSIGLMLMLFSHVRPRRFQHQFIFDQEGVDGSITSLNNHFRQYDHFQTNNTNRQILTELKDPQRRERLWKIYYSSREEQSQPHPQYYQTVATDTAIIGRINKKLANIHGITVGNDANANFMTSFDVSSNNTPNILSKSLNRMRRLSGVLTKPPVIRAYSESEDTHPVISETQVEVISNSSSQGSTNERSNRFTVEKVSDNHRHGSATKESDSQ